MYEKELHKISLTALLFRNYSRYRRLSLFALLLIVP